MISVEGRSLERVFLCQGRRYAEGGRLFLNGSGASLQGAFHGEKLTLFLFSEPISAGRNAYVRLTVDGRTERIRLPKGEKRITRDFPRGEHLFEIIKLTESANNSLAVEKVETDGRFLPPKEESALKIEFIGDSITTGFGVLSRETYGEYKTKEQDVTKAFPYLTARALGASYQVVAAGGWGIARSKYSPYMIPDFYENVDLLRNADKWDVSAFSPDYFVVTLGTNDFSYLADLSEPMRSEERAAVKARFLSFLKGLLKRKGKLILVYGFFDYPDLGVMTEEVKSELSSPRVLTLRVQSMNSLSDVKAGHPGKRVHAAAAKRLTALIRREEKSEK